MLGFPGPRGLKGDDGPRGLSGDKGDKGIRGMLCNDYASLIQINLYMNRSFSRHISKIISCVYKLQELKAKKVI